MAETAVVAAVTAAPAGAVGQAEQAFAAEPVFVVAKGLAIDDAAARDVGVRGVVLDVVVAAADADAVAVAVVVVVAAVGDGVDDGFADEDGVIDEAVAYDGAGVMEAASDGRCAQADAIDADWKRSVI